MHDLLEAIRSTTGSEGEVAWLPPEAFAVAGAEPWTDVPLMAPDTTAFRHFQEVDASRARVAGLTARSLKETLVALANWDRTRRDVELTCGMSVKQEERALAERQ